MKHTVGIFEGLNEACLIIECRMINRHQIVWGSLTLMAGSTICGM